MANIPQGYEVSPEMANISVGYNPEDEAQVVEWICARTGLSSPGKGREVVHEWLKDGLVLHSLFETFGLTQYKYSVTTPPAWSRAMAISQSNDNIKKFLKAIENMGVQKNVTFQSAGLVEGNNIAQVLLCMFAVSRAAMQKNVAGPHIGVNQPDENKREFDEATQRAGRDVIGL